jgi:predicted enzyme related to lactoylglutathione lyase
MGNPVVHFEIVGKDGAALQRFYGDLFGWTISPVPEMGYGLVEKEEGGIGGGVGQTQDGGGYVTFYVQVDDPQAYLDRAESLGARTVMPVTEVPGVVTFALFADPEGHVVGVVKAED